MAPKGHLEVFVLILQQQRVLGLLTIFTLGKLEKKSKVEQFEGCF